MTASQMRILSRLVSRYDEREGPITATEMATVVDSDPATLREFFENYESKHLLKPVDDGYRPTVTARELLELDIDDDALVILDTQPES